MAASLQEQLRRNLIADIARDRRTPLSGIQGSIEALQDGVFPLTTDNLTPNPGADALAQPSGTAHHGISRSLVRQPIRDHVACETVAPTPMQAHGREILRCRPIHTR